MSEQLKGLSKETLLQLAGKHFSLAENSPDEVENISNYAKSTEYARLAYVSGATNYEIAVTYLSSVTNKRRRQELLETYCDALWQEKNFNTLEEIKAWTGDTENLRKKFHLRDPLKSYRRNRPQTKIKELDIPSTFENDPDRQSLFELYFDRFKDDESFPNLGELRTWIETMIEVKTKYNLKDPLVEQRKVKGMKLLIKLPFNPRAN